MKQRITARRLSSVVRSAVLCAVGAGLGACAGGANSSFFMDPAKYELYNCQQLATAREATNKRVGELEGLMAKAETGAAGSLVSGLAYQTDYVTARTNRDAIDEKLAANNCPATPPTPAVAPAPARKRR